MSKSKFTWRGVRMFKTDTQALNADRVFELLAAGRNLKKFDKVRKITLGANFKSRKIINAYEDEFDLTFDQSNVEQTVDEILEASNAVSDRFVFGHRVYENGEFTYFLTGEGDLYDYYCGTNKRKVYSNTIGQIIPIGQACEVEEDLVKQIFFK